MRGVAALVALLLAAGACSAPPPAVTTPDEVKQILADERDVRELDDVNGELRFLFEGVRMVCVMDRSKDRLRLLAPVVRVDELTPAKARILLEANFHTALDARYASSGEILYAVYVHPLASLRPPQLRSALRQVANLVMTFGTTYSAGVLPPPAPGSSDSSDSPDSSD
jgi:hypothetical protein